MGASLLLFLLSFLLLHSWGFRFQPPLTRSRYSRTKSTKLQSSGDGGDENTPEVTVVDKEAISFILSEVSSLLKTVSPSDSPEVTAETISGEFDKIFERIKADSDLSSEAKERMALELNVALNSVEGAKASDLTLTAPVNREALEIPDSAVYYSAGAPYCVITGTGPVGMRVQELLGKLGGAAEVRYLDGSQINIAQESDLKFALKDAKTIIIAADALQSGKSKGFFDKEEPFTVMDEKGLKRVLNLIFEMRNQAATKQAIRIVALCKAAKESKGLASMITGGSGSEELEGDAVVLQCKSRNFGYCVINTGKLIEDEAQIPPNNSARPLAQKLKQKEPTSTSMLAYDDNPIMFTNSRVEPNEATKVGIAANSLLRAAGYVASNYTVNVLSRDVLDPVNSLNPSDKEWNDELLKTIGPEVERVPLKYATPSQVALKLQRVIEPFATPGAGGLITPVKLEKFANGVRVEFAPKESTYKTAAEERKLEKIKQNAVIAKQLSKSKYVAPEMDANFRKKDEGNTDNEGEQGGGDKAEKNKKQFSNKGEGGLEVIVDESERRVRIRRCNMSSTTIIKEESETILLKAILQTIQTIDNDYRILMERNEGKYKV